MAQVALDCAIARHDTITPLMAALSRAHKIIKAHQSLPRAIAKLGLRFSEPAFNWCPRRLACPFAERRALP